MKKIIAILAVAIIGMSAANTAKALSPQWEKGTMVVGAMFGYYPGIGGTLTGDYVLVDSWWMGHFTVGAEALYRHFGRAYAGYTYSYNDFAIAPRATYGLNITDAFEVHVGVLAGLGISTWRWSDTDTDKSLGLCYGGLAGIRYFFTDSFGLSAEVQYSGYGQYTNVGVCFKF